jgi:magnesium transporter
MLINCAAYQDGKKLADIAQEDIHAYLGKPGCFVWVALKDATAEELVEMQKQFGLHELAVEDASHGHQRPKLEEYGDSLFAVVHTVEAAGEELNVGELSIFAATITFCPFATAPSRVSPTCATAPSASRTCSSSDRVSCSTP